MRNPADLGRPFEDLDELREAFRESDLPILVDVLDWARIPESFRRQISREAVVMQSANGQGVTWIAVTETGE